MSFTPGVDDRPAPPLFPWALAPYPKARGIPSKILRFAQALITRLPGTLKLCARQNPHASWTSSTTPNITMPQGGSILAAKRLRQRGRG